MAEIQDSDFIKGWDSEFRFQTYPRFRIQILNRVYSRFSCQITSIQISKRVGIQDSDFKWQGFRIQISKRVGIQISNGRDSGFRFQMAGIQDSDYVFQGHNNLS